MSGYTTVAADDLVRLTTSILHSVGVPSEAAALTAADLVSADMEGVASHGVMLLPMYVARLRSGSVSNTAQGTIVSDRGGAVVLDAENGLGQVVAHRAAALASARAAKHGGLAAVAVRNAFHFGTAGRYARLIAEKGAVGIVMANTRPMMPAPGGAEPMLGNNPIAIALPTSGVHPVEVDMALSASAMGRIRLAAGAGRPIPNGWAVDENGDATTDAAAALTGMLLPAAGPKGFGLAFMVDLAVWRPLGRIGRGRRPAAVRKRQRTLCFRSVLRCHRCRAFRQPSRVCRSGPRSSRSNKPVQARARCRACLRAGRTRVRHAARGLLRPRSRNAPGSMRTRRRSRRRELVSSTRIGVIVKQQVSTDGLRQPNGHFSQATTIEAKGKLVFVSGMTARTSDGNIGGIGNVEMQTRQVCENIKTAIEAAGGTLDDVVRVDVYVRNMEHFETIHKVRREYFKPPLPASTMVEVVKMTSPDYPDRDQRHRRRSERLRISCASPDFTMTAPSASASSSLSRFSSFPRRAATWSS